MRSLSVKKAVKKCIALLVVTVIVMAFFVSCGDDSSASLKNAKIGDYITFGHYEQDSDTSNGKEAIEWLVLDKQGDKILVISKYALDCQPYNAEHDPVTWGTCALRVWLNRDFYNNAFSSEEKAKIPTVTVSPDTIPDCYDIDPGSATHDRMFLLNIYEAYMYFYSDDDRKCEPTEYVKSKDTFTYESGCCWWLRSPGGLQYEACYVEGNGSIDEYGDFVNRDFIAVRPAMWIDLGA